MPHACYAREGDIIYRFHARPARDAWVANKPRQRRAVPSTELSLRLKTGRPVEGLELRDGPDEPAR